MKKIIPLLLLATISVNAYAKRTVEDALSEIGTSVLINTMTGKKTSTQSVTSTINSSVDTNNKYTDRLAKAAIGVGVTKTVESQQEDGVITINDATIPKKDYQRLIQSAFNKAVKSGTRADLAKLDALIIEADNQGLDVSDVMTARQRYFPGN